MTKELPGISTPMVANDELKLVFQEAKAEMEKHASNTFETWKTVAVAKSRSSVFLLDGRCGVLCQAPRPTGLPDRL